MSISTVVVGVDGGAASHRALRVAIDEATAHGCRLMVVVCWQAEDDTVQPSTTETWVSAQTIAEHALDAVRVSDHERSLIVIETSEGEPGEILVHASRHATFLVVGSPSGGSTAGQDGGVVDHCVRHCAVPVIVVPPTA